MSRLVLVFGASVLVGTALVYGCGDATVSLAPKGDGGAPAIFFVPEAAPPPPPAPPALGTQRDRAGRPLVTLATIHPFDTDGGRAVAEDDYNANGDASAWGSYAGEIAKSLAVYDALDETCGNQALADGDAGDDNIQRYGALASLLADDRLWLDTTQTTCAHYLAVEESAVNKTPSMDCGGRALGYDVIDATYSLAAAGASSSAITDGVAKVASKTDGPTFPYLVAPQ